MTSIPSGGSLKTEGQTYTMSVPCFDGCGAESSATITQRPGNEDLGDGPITECEWRIGCEHMRPVGPFLAEPPK